MDHLKLPLRYPQEILQLPMYHANIRSRDEAKDFMKRYQQGEGSYIIRPNTTNDPSFVSITVSITPDGECCHAKVYIIKQNGTIYFYISEKQKFTSFHDLLRYYAEHRIHCTQNIDNIRLKNALFVQRPQSSRQLLVEKHASYPNNLHNGLNIGPKNYIQQDDFDPHMQGAHNISAQLSRRGNSLSHSLPKNANNKFPRQSSEISTPHQSYNSDMHRSVSESDIPERNTKYANANAMEFNVRMMIKCLPPAPLPKVENPNEDNDFYYTHVDVNKNFFQETYQFLKQNELCECGLRLVDSEFPQGWTVHRSQEAQTKNRIFFQHGEETTWEMPAEIVPSLTIDQIKFIMLLCQEGRCPIPNCLKPRLDREFVKKKPTNAQTLPNNIKLSMDSTSIKQLNIETEESTFKKSVGRFNGIPGTSSSEQSEETMVKQLARDRPLSFDSLPTTVITSKVGSPTPGLQENQAALQRKKDEVQHRQLNQELQGLKLNDDRSYPESNFFLKKK